MSHFLHLFLHEFHQTDTYFLTSWSDTTFDEEFGINRQISSMLNHSNHDSDVDRGHHKSVFSLH